MLAHSPHPVTPWLVLTFTIAYARGETGSRTANAAISVISRPLLSAMRSPLDPPRFQLLLQLVAGLKLYRIDPHRFRPLDVRRNIVGEEAFPGLAAGAPHSFVVDHRRWLHSLDLVRKHVIVEVLQDGVPLAD